MELLGILIGLGILELQHLIYPRHLVGFVMLVVFTDSCVMGFPIRYSALSYLFPVIVSFQWLQNGSLYKNIELMLEFLKAPFLVLHFLYFTFITFVMMLSARLLFMLMTLLSSLSVIRHLIFRSNQSWLPNLNLTYMILYSRLRQEVAC